MRIARVPQRTEERMRGRDMRIAMSAAMATAVLAAGLGSAAALAGGDGCDGKPCKTTTTDTGTFTSLPSPPATATVTVTTPATTTPAVTVTVTTPAPATPAVTVTTPGKTVVKGKPTCAHGDWDIWAPRCKPKLIAACKGPYRKEILRWCLRYEQAAQPKVKGREQQPSVRRAGGVTG